MQSDENLATELLAYFLRSAEETALQEFFAHYGLVLSESEIYQVRVQKQGQESRCIPDIQIQNQNGVIRAVVESKFQAGFTNHQPNSYIREIGEKGLLLFVVPEERRRLAFEKLLELSRSVFGNEVDCSDTLGQTKALVRTRLLEVTSWEETLTLLQRILSKRSPDKARQRLVSDIDQLRRFCKVAETETFKPLEVQQIQDDAGTSTLLRHLTWITQELIATCIDKQIVQPVALKVEIKVASDSSLFFGQNLELCGFKIWLGFWSRAWEDLRKSPLWIEFFPQDLRTRRILSQEQKEKGEGSVVKHQFPTHDEESWLMAIPLKANVLQDEVVNEAFQFVSDLKGSLDRATKSSADEPAKHTSSSGSRSENL